MKRWWWPWETKRERREREDAELLEARLKSDAAYHKEKRALHAAECEERRRAIDNEMTWSNNENPNYWFLYRRENGAVVMTCERSERGTWKHDGQCSAEFIEASCCRTAAEQYYIHNSYY